MIQQSNNPTLWICALDVGACCSDVIWCLHVRSWSSLCLLYQCALGLVMWPKICKLYNACVPTESRSLTRACRMDAAYCPCDAHPQGSVGTLCRLGYAVLQSLHLCTLWGHMCLSYFGNVFWFSTLIPDVRRAGALRIFNMVHSVGALRWHA